VLDQLFTSASLLVAPRSDENEEQLNDLINREENRRYQGLITFCPFPKRFRGDSSSNARAIAREPGSDRRLRAILPPEGRALVVMTKVYSGSDDERLRHADTYSRRQALISWLATLDPNSDEGARNLDKRINAWSDHARTVDESDERLAQTHMIAGDSKEAALRDGKVNLSD
jgi:hypothetical protein